MALPDRPLSRKEEYLAAIAGEEGVKPDRPLSRTEEYLEAIDEYLDTKANLVDGKVPASELPSYVDDVVEGYYYNSKFYEDEQHTDEITPESSKIYVDLPTGDTYRWGGTEYVKIGGGGEAIKVLTTDDLNYPVNNPSRVSLWLLPDGIYTKAANIGAVWAGNNTSSYSLEYGGIAFVTTDAWNKKYVFIYNVTSRNFVGVTSDGGTWNASHPPLDTADTLTSTSTTSALAANQGKVLKDTIDNRIRVESSAPTTSTSGALGQLWIDNTGPTIYILSSISGSTYTWTNLMA